MVVYKDYKNQEIRFVSSKEIRSTLRQTASIVHNIKSELDLARYTSHSICVGACVLLHAAGKDFEYIKFRLRWRSDAFRMYLRNVTELAVQHTAVLDNAVIQEESSTLPQEVRSSDSTTSLSNSPKVLRVIKKKKVKKKRPEEKIPIRRSHRLRRRH